MCEPDSVPFDEELLQLSEAVNVIVSAQQEKRSKHLEAFRSMQSSLEATTAHQFVAQPDLNAYASQPHWSSRVPGRARWPSPPGPVSESAPPAHTYTRDLLLGDLGGALRLDLDVVELWKRLRLSQLQAPTSTSVSPLAHTLSQFENQSAAEWVYTTNVVERTCSPKLPLSAVQRLCGDASRFPLAEPHDK